MAGINIATAYLTIIPSMQGIQGEMTRSGEEAGGLFGGAFGKILKGGLVLGAVKELGAAAGAAFSATFGEAMERQATIAKAGASLGISDAEAKNLGSSAGKLYAQAYGDSFGSVSDALSVVKSSLKDLGADQLEGATKKALSFSQAFDVDVSRSVQSVSTLLGSGLVASSDEAFDVITKASQKVPAALREDVLDASDEYGQFFRTLGFNASEAFGALTAASDKGVFGIDKTGDAIKEFTIRATDMSTTSVGAFKTIGLDAQTMANQILAGGDTAQSATQQIVDGLIGIQDPATQANTAIALFGTPLEDLGVQDIPKFLASLDDASGGLGDFAGAAADVDAKLNDTIGSKFTSLTRTLEGFGPTISAAFFPVVGPILDGLTGIATKAQESLQSASEHITAFFDVVTSGEGYDAIGGPDSLAGRVATSFYGLNEKMSGEIIPAFKGNVAEIYGLLVKGDFTGVGSFQEDSPIVDFLLTIRDTVGETFGQVFDTLGQVWGQIGPPLMEAFTTIWEAVKPLVPTFLQLFQAFNPVGLLFKALLPVLPQIAGVVGELAKVLADGVARALQAVAPLFQKVVDVINRLMPFVTKLVESLLPPLVSLFDKVAPLLDAVLDALVPVVDALVDALIPAIDALMPTVERVFTFIADTITNIMTVFGGVIDVLTGIFTGDWEKVWTGVKEIFGGIWDQIKNIFGTLWDVLVEFFTNLGPKLWEIVQGLASQLVEWGGQFLGWIWQGIQDLWNNTIWPWFVSLPGLAWEGIQAAASWLVERGAEFLQWLWDGITAKAEEVWGWFAALPGTVWEWIKSTAGGAGEWIAARGSEFIGWIRDGIESGASAIWDWFAKLPGRIWDGLIAIKDKVLSIGSDFVNWIVEGVTSVAGKIWDAIVAALTGDSAASGRPEDSLTGANLPGVTPGGIARGGLVAKAGGGMMDFLSAENAYGRQWVRPQGYISGPGGPVEDAIPTWLSDGEYVNRAASVAKYFPALDALNSDKPEKAMWSLLPHLAGGGFAGAQGDIKQFGSDLAWSYANALIDQSKKGVASQGASGFNSSQNPTTFGWQRATGIVPFSWNGHPFVGGIADRTQSLWTGLMNELVPNIPGGLMAPIWAYENRDNVNSPGNASFHAYGLAADINAPQNPNGVSGYGRSGPGVIPAALAHSLAAKYGMLWGGDFTGTPDPMHFEIHVSPDSIGGVGGSTSGGWFGNIVSTVMGKLGLGSSATPAAVDGGPFPPLVERWRPLMTDVLTQVGKYLGLNLLGDVDRGLHQMDTESSGREDIWNTTDSNAQRGTPSGGLMQVIQPTFEAALRNTPFANLIGAGLLDPRANITASALYGLVTGPYHSLARAWRGVAYRNGGMVPDLFGGGIDSVPAMLTPQESVLTPPETKAYQLVGDALASGEFESKGGFVFTGDIHMGSGGPDDFFDEALWRARVSA